MPRVATLLPLPYPMRVGAVLADWGVVDMPRWQKIHQDTTCNEPALCPIAEGIWALELWHTPDIGLHPTAWPLWQVYAADGDANCPADIERLLWLADIYSGYCDLVNDGIILNDDKVNVFASVRHPAFLAAAIAQKEGLPIYTVVGADDGTLARVARGKPLPPDWTYLTKYLSDDTWQRVFADVLPAVCSEEEAADTASAVLEENGYLMHPMTAAAAMLAEEYREEAESRHQCLVIAPFHPYVAAEKLCRWLLDQDAPTHAKAMAALELETGWAIPDELLTESAQLGIIQAIQQRYGD